MIEFNEIEHVPTAGENPEHNKGGLSGQRPLSMHGITVLPPEVPSHLNKQNNNQQHVPEYCPPPPSVTHQPSSKKSTPVSSPTVALPPMTGGQTMDKEVSTLSLPSTSFLFVLSRCYLVSGTKCYTFGVGYNLNCKVYIKFHPSVKHAHQSLHDENKNIRTDKSA